MNRVIKFRASHYGKSNPDYPTGWVYFGVEGIPKSIENYIDYSLVHQFTGVLDKNGKEIYEGDIIESGTEYNDDGNGKFLVCFSSGVFFALRFYSDDGMDDYSLSCADEYYQRESPYQEIAVLGHLINEEKIHVIGNIYDNPELLNSQP